MTLKEYAESIGVNYATVKAWKHRGKLVADGDGYVQVAEGCGELQPGASVTPVSAEVLARLERIERLLTDKDATVARPATCSQCDQLLFDSEALRRTVTRLESELADCQAAKLVTPEYHEIPTKRSSVLGSSVRDSSMVLDADERFTVDSDMPQFYKR